MKKLMACQATIGGQIPAPVPTCSLPHSVQLPSNPSFTQTLAKSTATIVRKFHRLRLLKKSLPYLTGKISPWIRRESNFHISAKSLPSGPSTPTGFVYGNSKIRMSDACARLDAPVCSLLSVSSPQIDGSPSTSRDDILMPARRSDRNKWYDGLANPRTHQNKPLSRLPFSVYSLPMVHKRKGG